jgi:GT2 family glycosyltransferase
MTVKLVAIVNSFNRLSLMQEGLPTLVSALKESDLPAAIVIFDAGSTDGSIEWIEEFAQSAGIRIELIIPEPGDDTSFSGGINRATRYAQELFPQVEYYFFFETDNSIASAEPLKNALRLLNSISYLAAVGFTVTKHSGDAAGVGCSFPTIGQFVLGQHLTCIMHLDHPIKNSWRLEDDITWTICDVVFTSPLVVRCTAWEKSRGLDAREFPFSDCDVDWAWRIAKLGWKIAVIEAQGVIHDNRETLSEWSGKRVIHFHQARMKLLNRHARDLSSFKTLLFARHLMEYLLLQGLRLAGKASPEKVELRKQLMRSVFNDYN